MYVDAVDVKLVILCVEGWLLCFYIHARPDGRLTVFSAMGVVVCVVGAVCVLCVV